MEIQRSILRSASKAILLSLVLIFAASQAQALYPPYGRGGTVSCRNSIGQVIWTYVMKTTPSRRLTSDVVYVKNGSPQIISSIQVAQYQASRSEIYMLIDDLNERPVLALQVIAPLLGKPFRGTVLEISPSTGVVTKTLA